MNWWLVRLWGLIAAWIRGRDAGGLGVVCLSGRAVRQLAAWQLAVSLSWVGLLDFDL